MFNRNRREFLGDVGRGMLIAGVGSGLALDLGLASAKDVEGSDRLTFGALEPLVGLMQQTPADKLLAILVEKLKGGTDLKQLTAAAALANARAFGGEDYIGFHTLMAFAPALRMAGEMPEGRAALPVLKVIHRNSRNLQETGKKSSDTLHPIAPAELSKGRPGGEVLLEAVRKKDMKLADATFAALAKGTPEDAFNDLLYMVQDGQEVHRVVLPYRAWVLMDIVGREHAHTLLRQSVHYCVKSQSDRQSSYFVGARNALPKLLEKYKLPREGKEYKNVDDAFVDKLSQTIFNATPEQAAEAAAAALSEGISPTDVGQAISLATNQLVLRDVGRLANQTAPNKGVGSVHGDSIGVHACDSANAWRNMAKVANPRNAAACLILSAWQMARDRGERGGTFLTWKPRPWTEQLDAVKSRDQKALLGDAEEAIKANDQARACAIVARYGELGHSARNMFDLLLKFGVSEDGVLHAEKYYQTAADEFAATRAPFRWRQLIALARVTASECNQPAPGYAEACKLLKV